jgi:hypothetical protein
MHHTRGQRHHGTQWTEKSPDEDAARAVFLEKPNTKHEALGVVPEWPNSWKEWPELLTNPKGHRITEDCPEDSRKYG